VIRLAAGSARSPETMEHPSSQQSSNMKELAAEVFESLSRFMDTVFGKDPIVLLRIINLAVVLLCSVTILFILAGTRSIFRYLYASFFLLLILFAALVNWFVNELLKVRNEGQKEKIT